MGHHEKLTVDKRKLNAKIDNQLSIISFGRGYLMCDKCGCGDSNAEQTFEEKVKSVIESIRPMLKSHGGDIELVGTEADNSVKVRLQGACSGCPGAQMTLKMGVEQLLKEKVPEVKEVIAIN